MNDLSFEKAQCFPTFIGNFNDCSGFIYYCTRQMGKGHLHSSIVRNIDGDESNQLTSVQCFEGEYRSLIAINDEGEPEMEEDYHK